MSEFRVLEKLGEGSFAGVYKVLRKSDDKLYALKKVKFDSMSSREKQNALNEIRILASISHENVISYKEAFIDEECGYLCIVLEYAEKGDLNAKIKTHKKTKTHFPEREIWRILIQSLKGLKALHDLHILHRDIKSANIFVGSDERVLLGDLNVAKIVNGLAYTQTGTPYYASPEVWKDCPYNSKSDIWSLGCVIFELAALHPPFQASDMKSLYRKVTRGSIPKLPLFYSAELYAIIKMMLQVKPKHRPSAERLLSHSLVVKNSEGEVVEQAEKINGELIKSIRLPPNLRCLKHRLPAAKYNNSRNLSADRNDFDKENVHIMSVDKPKQPQKTSLTPSPSLRLSHKLKKDTQKSIFKDSSPKIPVKLPPLPKF